MKLDDILYISGCLPLDVHGEIVGPGDIQKQTAQALANVKAIAEAGGSQVEKIIKTIVSIPGNLCELGGGGLTYILYTFSTGVS